MRAVVQRVRRAQVDVDGETVGAIGSGLLVLLGVATGDTLEQCVWMADRVAKLRIFPDDAGKMNLDLRTVGGSALVVSQFTLFGDCASGRRPGFTGRPAPSWHAPWWTSSPRNWWLWEFPWPPDGSVPTCRWSWSTMAR